MSCCFLASTHSDHPDPILPNAHKNAVGRLWQIVDKYGVSHLYTAPTAIRSLMREGTYIHACVCAIDSVGGPSHPRPASLSLSLSLSPSLPSSSHAHSPNPTPGDHHVKAHSRATLKVLGSVGEPINPEAWRWYHEVRRQELLLAACLPVFLRPSVRYRSCCSLPARPCSSVCSLGRSVMDFVFFCFRLACSCVGRIFLLPRSSSTH